MRRFLAWCAERGRTAVLDRATVAAFVADLLDSGAQAAAIVRFMAETGARAGDVVALGLADVDLRAYRAIVRRGGRVRRITDDEHAIFVPGPDLGQVIGVGDEHLVGGADDCRRYRLVPQQSVQLLPPAVGGGVPEIVVDQLVAVHPGEPPRLILRGRDVAECGGAVEDRGDALTLGDDANQPAPRRRGIPRRSTSLCNTPHSLARVR